MARQHDVAKSTGQRSTWDVPGAALLEVLDRDALDDVLGRVVLKGRDVQARERTAKAGDRDRSGPTDRRDGPGPGELIAELALRPTRDDVGDLQLVVAEQQHHDPEGDQDLTDAAQASSGKFG